MTMKKIIAPFVLLFLAVLATSFYWSAEEQPTNETYTTEDWAKDVKWYTWEEAIEANKKNPKKMMIDVYTDWCGWCKVMDKKTFSNKKVADYLNEHFYPIKLDAEMKENIVFNGHTFEYLKQGRRGVHTLAYSLLEGKMSYPSLVYMDQDVKRILISPGFKDVNQLMNELQFTQGEHYKTQSFQEFINSK